MPTPANLVHETSSTTGTGDFTLSAVNGKQRFSDAFGTGGSDVFDYFISNQDAAEYERGTGSMSDANTLVRDTVIESTNSNAAVNFSSGTKDVACDVPAAKQVVTDLSQTLTNKTITVTNTGLTVGSSTPFSDSSGTLTLQNVDALDSTTATTIRDALGVVGDNLLINGGFTVAQRGTSFTSATAVTNNDDTYLLDRWILLSDGNDILDVSQETTTIPTPGYAAIKLDVETANKRAGICQILENRVAANIIGSNCSLSFAARKGGSNSTVDTLRYIVASWTSTADSVTSDIVSSWSTEGNNPTLATNWTIEGSGTVTLTTSYQTFTAEDIDIDTASTKNVAVFIMIENDDGTVGDLAYVTNIKLESGASATDWRARFGTQERELCNRYFQSSFVDGTTPADSVASAPRYMGFGVSAANVDTQVIEFGNMRATPTAAFYASNNGTPVSGQWAAFVSSTWTYGSTSLQVATARRGHVRIAISVSAGVVYTVAGHYTLDAEL